MPHAPHTEDARFKTLLERWAVGDVTAAEERELLQLAQNDAFRKEALDGFLQFPDADHATRLSNVRVRMRTASPGMPRWRIFSWSAAAAVLILCCIWWLRPTATEKKASDHATIAAVEDERKLDELPQQMNRVAETTTPSKPSTSKPVPPAAQKAPGRQGEVSAKKDAIKETQMAPESRKEPMADALPPLRSAPVIPTPASAKPAPAPVGTQDKLNTPESWWLDLQRYLRTNARLTTQARNNNVSGIVRLRGRLIPDGRMVNIEFAETLGYGLEVEALRLMQDYNWPLNKDSILEVEIKFVR